MILPPRPLFERFSPSKNSLTSFWDFYALYLLYFKVEGWQGKYSTGTITSEARVRLIREAFWASAVDQAYKLGNVLMKASAEELDSIFDEYIIPQDEVRKWGAENPALYEKIQLIKGKKPSSFWETLTISDFERLFRAPFWRSDLSDLYGGPPWEKIVRTLGKLIENLKGKDVDSLAIAVDAVYDLEHNTGSILTKFKSPITKAILDKRASIGSLEEFLPMVSQTVKNLIKSYIGIIGTVSEARRLAMMSVASRSDETSLVRRLLEGL